MKNKENKKTLTLQERHAIHRRSHPRDKISFGEEPVAKPKRKKTKPATRKELTPPFKRKPPKPTVKKQPEARGRNETMIASAGSRLETIRCKECGAMASRERVRTGDCHTPRYGKGDFGQGYSGNNSRGHLHGGHIERRR